MAIKAHQLARHRHISFNVVNAHAPHPHSTTLLLLCVQLSQSHAPGSLESTPIISTHSLNGQWFPLLSFLCVGQYDVRCFPMPFAGLSQPNPHALGEKLSLSLFLCPVNVGQCPTASLSLLPFHIRSVESTDLGNRLLVQQWWIMRDREYVLEKERRIFKVTNVSIVP